MLDLNKIESRKELLEFFMSKGNSEYERVRKSQYECDIYEGRIEGHVTADLKQKYDTDTVKEMSMVDMINMAKRVAKQEGSIYRDAPERKFANAKEKTNIMNWYSQTSWNSRMLKSNRLFKLQNQNVIYIPFKNKKPNPRILKKHQVHVYMDEEEKVYLIPNLSMTNSTMKEEDRKKKERYTVWSKNFNFIMDGDASIIGDKKAQNDLSNPLIDGEIPIIDVAYDFENEYWNNEEGGLAKFTVLVNSIFADILYIMKMQGFAVGVLTGPAEMLKLIDTLKISPGKFVKIPTVLDNDGNTVSGDVKFTNPGADLAASLQVLESVVYAFLTSRGVDPKSFSLSGNGESFSSGWERLLSLIEKFDASKEDLDLYEGVEHRYIEIIKAYSNTYKGQRDALDDIFIVPEIDSITMNIEYSRPEMVETEQERTDRINNQTSLGVKSKLQGFMEINRITNKEDAIEALIQMKEDNKKWDSIFGKEEVEIPDDKKDPKEKEEAA